MNTMIWWEKCQGRRRISNEE